ncbi:recombinase family protein [Streptomyces sp. NPDC048392]|uniref:recombinase family protein n=1 Tax=Streptomyces sp. NPDC048392 TaxID=3365543 RepID=UPI003722BBDB
MHRDDYPALRALGFEDDELKELGLWEPAIGSPANLAEMYVRRSKKKDSLSALRLQVRRMCDHGVRDNKKIRHVWFEQKSASKSYIRREEFEKATAAVTNVGLSKALYVYKTSRLSRRGMGQVGLLLDTFEEQGAYIFVVSEGLDSRTSRTVLAFLSEQARDQVKDLGDFVKLGMDAHKADGKWTGGVAPYGLRAVKGEGRLERHPEEYPTARRIADYLSDRKTPAWIASTLNEEGLKTRHGRNWQATGIIALAHAVTWAGLVAQRERILDKNGQWTGKYHRGGTPLLDKNGEPISCGEGVITFAEHVKIKSILASRARKNGPVGNRARGKREVSNLLSSNMHCGRCESIQVCSGPAYRCYARTNEGPHICEGVSIGRERADDAVTQAWFGHILSLSPESATLHEIAREWLAYKDPEKEARKAQVTAALESAVGRELKLNKEFFVLGRMTEEMFDSMRVQVGEQITALKAELAELTREADLSPLMDPEALAALWNGAGIAGQRALLRAALTEKGITLLPSEGRGYRVPAIDRLEFHWREASDPAWDTAFEAGVKQTERTRERTA